MKAEELRFGNWFSYRGCFEYQVTALLELSVEFLHINNKHYFRDYVDIKPIPLTEEWLVKFGFERTYYGRELNGFHLEASSRIVKTDVLCGFSLEVIPEEKYIPINDVHQLQNLYYALTNEELTIKLK